MVISGEIVAILSGIGVLNSLFLAFYFLFLKKGNRVANVALFMLLFSFSLMIGKSLLLYLLNDLSDILKKIGLAGYTSIGAASYVYILSYTKRNFHLNKYHLFHLIPALLLLISIFFPGSSILFQYKIFYLSILTIILIYIILSIRYYLHCRNNIENTDLYYSSIDFLWIRTLIIGIILVWLAYFIYVSFGILYMTGAMMYSFIVYVMVYFAFLKPKSIFQETKIKNVMHEENIQYYLNKLKKILEDDKIYKEANLTLPMLASKLNINTNQLSFLINNKLNKSFPDLINEYRINDVKQKLMEPENEILTIESIAYDCGFNSLSSFRSAFKKIEKTTPSKYKKKLLK